jgi:hypothetical protein
MSNNNNTSRRGNSINNSSSSKGFLVLVFLAISGLTFCSYRFITNRGCLDFDFHNNNNDNNDNNNINREENKLREVDDIDNSVLSHTTADDNNNDSSKQQEQEQQNSDINDGIEREEDDFDVKGKRDDDHDDVNSEEEEEGEEGEAIKKSSSTNRKPSSSSSSGCTPNKVREFTAEALKNPKELQRTQEQKREWFDVFGEDLRKRYNFTTCAVVGNSGNLLRPPRLNTDIDEHSVVIRLNAAPTSGRYGQRVGRKTTLRFLNAARAKTYLVGGCSRTMPCDEGSTLVATRGMPFAPQKVITNAHLSVVRGRNLVLKDDDDSNIIINVNDNKDLSPQMEKRKNAMETQLLKMSDPESERLSVAQAPSNAIGAVKRVIKAYKSAYVEKCGEEEAKKLFKGPETPSTGFMAVIFALHMCSETVSVYGFKKQLKPYQYFRMRVKPSEVHDFTVEAEILKAMAKDGVLRMPGIVQERIRGGGGGKKGVVNKTNNSIVSISSSSSSSSSSSNKKPIGKNSDDDEWFDSFLTT